MPGVKSLGLVRWLMIGPFLVAVALLAVLAVVGVDLLSSVRAYVAGESRWSRAQKDAVFSLERYAATGEPDAYRRFQRELAVLLGDRQARLALQQDPPDRARAVQGLLAGGNHAGDVDGMVRLFLRGQGVSHMARAIEAWAEADREIEALQSLGERLHRHIAQGDRHTHDFRALAARLPELDRRLTVLEERFSDTLGEASRQARRWVLGLTLALVALMALGTLWAARVLVHHHVRVERQMRETNERWELAADAANIGVFDWDVTRQRTRLDARAAALYGMPPVDVEGATAEYTRRVVHPDDLERLDEAMTRALSETCPESMRFRVLLPGGALRHLEAVARVRKVEGATGLRLIGTLRDVTVEVQAARLQLDKEAAERADRAKGEFLSRVSHELRTPLNAVLGFSELLQGDTEPALTPAQAQRVQHVIDAGRHLLALIDDILDYSRLEERGVALTLQPVALAAVLKASLAQVEPMARRMPVSLQAEACDPALSVLGEPRRLEQVFVNLLSNAVKYNRAGGAVRVSCTREGEMVCVQVSDTGAGLSAAQLAQLFQPFNRLGAEFSKVPGSGLGLVITQQLLRRLGGRLDVASTEGAGTCMQVRLAVVTTLQPAAAAAGA